MRFAHWLLCAVLGPWLCIAGVVGLALHLAVMEALVVVLAGFGLIVAAGVFLYAEIHAPVLAAPRNVAGSGRDQLPLPSTPAQRVRR